MAGTAKRRGSNVHLAMASARSRLAATHHRLAVQRISALGLDPAAGVTEYADAHGLSAWHTRSLTNRVLAAFSGMTSGPPIEGPLLPPPPPMVLPPAGIFRRLLRRLRPPRDEARAEWRRMHEGHTESALLDVHALNVLEVNAAAGGSLRDLAATIDHYLRETDTRESMRVAIEVLALDRAYRAQAEAALAPTTEAGVEPVTEPPHPVEAAPASAPMAPHPSALPEPARGRRAAAARIAAERLRRRVERDGTRGEPVAAAS